MTRWLNAWAVPPAPARPWLPGCNAYVNRTSVTSEQAIAAELEAALGLVLSLCDCGAVKETYSDDACVECLRLESASHRGVSAKTAGRKAAA